MLREQPGKGGLAVLCLLALSLVACSTSQPTASEPQDAVASKDTITVENLLRWPLEGGVSNERFMTALGQLWVLQPRQGGQRYGEGQVRLTDGYALNMAMIRTRSGAADIGVAPEPCLTPTHAAALTGAMLDPVTQDAHGVDRGQHYRVVRSGVALTFDTTPTTYACVTSIHIRPEQEAPQ